MRITRAIGYTRVSTAGQVLDGVSLEAQKTRITDWCRVDGLRLVHVYTDAGKSGTKADNRPALQSALDAVCKAAPAALIVYSLSRLARSTKDAIAIAERLDKAGADLVSLSERIDTTTAAGKMVFRMLAVLAEFERDLVSERTTAALAMKKANGQRVGTVPYGYTVADDGAMLVPEESEQTIIVEIEALRATGSTLQRIAAELTKRKVPTKTQRSSRWSHQAIARILARKRPVS